MTKLREQHCPVCGEAFPVVPLGGGASDRDAIRAHLDTHWPDGGYMQPVLTDATLTEAEVSGPCAHDGQTTTALLLRFYAEGRCFGLALTAVAASALIVAASEGLTQLLANDEDWSSVERG